MQSGSLLIIQKTTLWVIEIILHCLYKFWRWQQYWGGGEQVSITLVMERVSTLSVILMLELETQFMSPLSTLDEV